MKKLLAVLVALVSVICIAFAFVGCGNDQTEEVEVKGRITRLRNAYEDNGWLDDNDLKSIACRQYDCYGMQENPYAGLYKQKTEISTKEESDFKKGYCDKYNNQPGNKPELEPSDIKITNYYGTYENNVVAEVIVFSEESLIAENKMHIGVVDFISDYNRDIYVFHYDEDWSAPITLTGTLFDMSMAYEEGLLDENDLKSIACFCYDFYNEKNPYKGAYVQPEEKLSKETRGELKKAYLWQIAKQPKGDLDYVNIYKYFGTYKGYIVVGMNGYDGCYGTAVTEVYGVTNVNWGSIYLYHSTKAKA